jgi:hypothetical protein
MNTKNFLLSALLLLLTSGCNGTYHTYYQTLKISLKKQKDTQITLFEVRKSKIDIIHVKRGERPKAIMALAYFENGQHKWVSNDNVMLIIESGRIIRTLGLSDNLIYLSNTDLDPLKSLPVIINNKPQPQTWTRVSDRNSDEYGYPMTSIFKPASTEELPVLSLNIAASLYVETVIYEASSDYIQLNDSWKNYYWYSKGGSLIKSVQKFSPLSEPLEITYLSRIARLNQ